MRSLALLLCTLLVCCVCTHLVADAASLLRGNSDAEEQLEQSLLAIRADAKSSFLYDSAGRVRFFHGVNAVQKGIPWYPFWLLNDTIVDQLASWGMNVIRVGWMFTGYEPAPGVFNSTYLAMQQAVVAKLASRGIYSLLDVHQDVLSTKFCLYDGFPLWTINKSVPDHPFPWPLDGPCWSRQWGMNEVTEASARCFQDIFSNNHGMRDDFVGFWRESAKQWAGNTNVIGLEIINEPFAGDVYADPDLFLPGVAGQKNLMPFYDIVSAAIREYDKEHLIFYEPTTWGMIFDNKIAGTGFSHVPGGDEYRNRSVLSYHYYCASFGDRRAFCDPVTGPLVFEAVTKDVVSTGGAGMMTEFGECSRKEFAECSYVMDLADKHFQSWIEWGMAWDGGNPPDPGFVNVVSRTYARAVAGVPERIHFDSTTNDFEFCYTIDTSIQAPTEVFAQFALHYPNGAKAVSSTANVHLDVQVANNIVLATPSSPSVNGQSACIQLKAHP